VRALDVGELFEQARHRARARAPLATGVRRSSSRPPVATLITPTARPNARARRQTTRDDADVTRAPFDARRVAKCVVRRARVADG
jgi:hypothetical protein